MTIPVNQLLSSVVQLEGNYSNDPKDPGGETKWGVTRAVARENGYSGPMVDMKRTDALAIYQSQYFQKPGFDRVFAVSPGIAAELLECGINMGVKTASVFLQRSLNALNREQSDYVDIKVDGSVGPATVTALSSFLKLRGDEGEHVILKCLNSLQAVRYIELAERNEGLQRFLFGWISNRVSLSV